MAGSRRVRELRRLVRADWTAPSVARFQQANELAWGSDPEIRAANLDQAATGSLPGWTGKPRSALFHRDDGDEFEATWYETTLTHLEADAFDHLIDYPDPDRDRDWCEQPSPDEVVTRALGDIVDMFALLAEHRPAVAIAMVGVLEQRREAAHDPGLSHPDVVAGDVGPPVSVENVETLLAAPGAPSRLGVTLAAA